MNSTPPGMPACWHRSRSSVQDRGRYSSRSAAGLLPGLPPLPRRRALRAVMVACGLVRRKCRPAVSALAAAGPRVFADGSRLLLRVIALLPDRRALLAEMKAGRLVR